MKKNFLIISSIALIALISFAFTAKKNKGYSPGDKATDFNLMNIDNTLVSLSDYSDAKGFIVTFTCNHCPYAVKYEDRIIALDAKYKSLGYPVIAINPNDSVKYPSDAFSKMKERATEKGFTFPYLLDETQNIAKKYGALKTPMKANMVFTVEPGIYIPNEKMGIRLEDDVVIQEKGEPFNLMKNIPIEVAEIEELMNKI